MQEENKNINLSQKIQSNAYTNEDLRVMQGWSLERKVQVTQTRIIEWYQKWNGQAYVSFSGGKDSTVVADLAARVCKMLGYKLTLWFSDTGLEYPEVRDHVKQFTEYLKEKYNIEVELIMDYPKDKNGKRITFKNVIDKYGYPLISKEAAQKIYEARRCPTGVCARRFNEDSEYATKYDGRFSMVRWKWLRDSNIPISHMCCNIMKKKPSKKYEKESGNKPIIATMACESSVRKQRWLKNGCNAFDTERPISTPISFWTEQDVLKYIKDYKIPIASVYGDILINNKGKYYTTKCDRTGCVFCGFGCHLEKEPNRFQRLKQTHPKLWEYCMKPWAEGGLGMKEVLEYIGVKIE